MSSGDYYGGIIEYWKWDSWISEYVELIKELYQISGIVISLYNELKRKLDGYTLLELYKDDKLKQLVLGGWKETSFESNAMGRYTNSLYGVNFNKDDLKALLFGASESLEEILSKIKVRVEEPKHIEIVKNIHEFSRRSLMKTKIEVEERKVGGEESVDVYIEVWRDLLDKAISILPQYNPWSFFICSTRIITKAFLERAYPRLAEDKTVTKKLELTELTKFDLIGKIKEDYTIFHYPKGSLGRYILRLIIESFRLTRKIGDLFEVSDQILDYLNWSISQVRGILSEICEIGQKSYCWFLRDILGLKMNVNEDYDTTLERGRSIYYSIQGPKMITRGSAQPIPVVLEKISPILFMSIGGLDYDGKGIKIKVICST